MDGAAWSVPLSTAIGWQSFAASALVADGSRSPAKAPQASKPEPYLWSQRFFSRDGRENLQSCEAEEVREVREESSRAGATCENGDK